MTKINKKIKIALVHDFLREFGGAERVLLALHELFPDAPVYTAFIDQQALGKHWQFFADWDWHETWFAKLPLIKKLYSPLRFLAPKAFADLDLSSYDVVISSSNAFEAKAVQASKGKHICYCHTPPRALYGYSTMSNWKKNPFIRLGGTLINHYMRVIDYQVAQKVDHFIANSQEVKKRIKKFYRRDAVVINPPVEVPAFLDIKMPMLLDAAASSKQAEKQSDVVRSNQDYYLFVSRLGLQKHPELAIQACQQLNLPLKVAGTGPLLSKLKELVRSSIFGEIDGKQAGKITSKTASIVAGSTQGKIEFLGAVSDQELTSLYAGAKALLYPVEDEDFGMVPVEAMGHGIPVIAHHSGGPKETVVDGKTGLFFEELTVQSLVAAIKKFEQTKAETWDRQKIHRHAQQFNKKQFQRKILALVKKVI